MDKIDKMDNIVNAFYDEDFDTLFDLTGIKASSQYEFECKFSESE